ncbi:LysM peptidoglycan-binding domain-containing protein [Clostridium sp. AL.422]|uniref:LysM peptidoglycan-binding domain-containing protein n=1 Tax=Clostridium TaxID=1485 RepID=UPI00293DE468|nr:MULTISPECIES: LysM peptidoglycan-binding domain-containing protein [unclassified Clostridium]MDV4151708.1 LysM peptidoglycan-binding domain-containing protein [Clostridium sp. AL.422]
MSRVFGIDVSTWQGNFNFNQAANEGVKFAIIRGAYNRRKDDRFEEYYRNAKAIGLSVGVYQYSMATTVEEALSEAKFLEGNVLNNKQFELPIYLDIEDNVHKNLTKNQVSAIAKAWLDYLEERGFFVGIYSSKSFLENYLNEDVRTDYSIWVAEWARQCTYSGPYGMWQFGGETNLIRSNKVAGVVCDQNYMIVDYPSLIKGKRMNGYGANNNDPKDNVDSGSGGNGNNDNSSPSSTTYVVQPGDNLSTIAAKFGMNYQTIASMNGISNPNLIYPGQVLLINGSSNSKMYYTVRPGDTLSEIATRHGVTYQSIANLNGIKNPDLIYPGEILRII